MNDFVSRLVDAPQRAALRPVLRSVFEPTPQLQQQESGDRTPEEKPPSVRGLGAEPTDPPAAAPQPVVEAAPQEAPPRSAQPLSRVETTAASAPIAAREAEPARQPRPRVPQALPARRPEPRADRAPAVETTAPVTLGPVTPAVISHPVRRVLQTVAAAPPAPHAIMIAPPAPDQSGHVSIGRVEVREPAAAPTTAPTKPRTPRRAPVLSLDDYLGARS
jgi:hypothetical protein